MNLGLYKRPYLNSYSSEEILNIFGPGCGIYDSQVSLEFWRAAKLDNKPAKYKIAKLLKNRNVSTIVKIKENIC